MDLGCRRSNPRYGDAQGSREKARSRHYKANDTIKVHTKNERLQHTNAMLFVRLFVHD